MTISVAGLVCDEVRTEINGKKIYIGVYADTLVFQMEAQNVAHPLTAIAFIRAEAGDTIKSISFRAYGSAIDGERNIENALPAGTNTSKLNEDYEINLIFTFNLLEIIGSGDLIFSLVINGQERCFTRKLVAFEPIVNSGS